MEANSLRYSEANKYFATGIKEAMEGARGAIPGGFTGIWDKATKNGSIERIEIVKEEIHGDEATVTCNTYYKDGTKRLADATEMKREKGIWRMSIPPGVLD